MVHNFVFIYFSRTIQLKLALGKGEVILPSNLEEQENMRLSQSY